MSDVKPVPDGYPVVSPGLAIDGAAAAIEFYKSIFGATERMRMPGPDGKIAHCELMFGNSVVMLGDPAPDMDFLDPKTVGGTPVNLYVYVEDADAAFAAALAAGAKELTPMTTQFYGDRSGSFEDPWGHRWTVATHVEDVPPDEMDRRMAEMFGGS
ncbi:VOC family protein [Streptomyces gardneri]|uniref:VOC family protein n=1 Tax=Nocardia TaxID=1817 RepID=UPI001359197C|nr:MULTISPECIES: VOC family protein [Nocardia]MBF6169360.1 VOC family protein [Streptomyces gardneri]MBF6209334.1 VOC family protein [Streptomyces gardneri]UAK32261.1 VOC family protein [Nocardia asteroides]